MKSTHHSFDTELAAIYGINGAILIHHFQHWISFNQRMKKNLIEGRTWSYQTRQEIQAHFPYLSDKEIRGAIDRLVKGKVLIKGNFNKTPFDRTIWYAFVTESDFLNKLYDVPKGPMEVSIGPIRGLQKGQTIPDPLTDTETDPPPLPPPTIEEEEEISKRLRERPKGFPEVKNVDKWKKTVLKELRKEARLLKNSMILIRSHQNQSKKYENRLINEDRVSVCKDAVEFTCGQSYVRVPYNISDEEWKRRTERWFKEEE